MSKNLVALAFYYANTSMLDAHRPQPMDETVEGPVTPYRLVKLFDDGTDEPVVEAKVDLAVEYVQERGWKAWGYWINGSPALAWARLPEDFERVWDHQVWRAPCRYAGQRAAKRYNSGAYAGGLVKVGQNGYIVPTRSRAEIYRLRERFPYYRGDLLMTPIEVLEADARQHEEFMARNNGPGSLGTCPVRQVQGPRTKGNRLFNGSIERAVEKAMAKVDTITAQLGG